MIEQKKTDALAILQRIEQQAADGRLADGDGAGSDDTQAAGLVDKLFGYTTRRLTSADPAKAVARVETLRRKHPGLSAPELVEKLVKAKCQQAATIGAATSAASIFPGLGTALSVTVGLAVDIGSTLKMHSELVLEIAEAHGHRLNDSDRGEVLLAVTGLSAGMSRLSGNAVKGLSQKFSEIAVQKWLAKAVPAVGMAASATTNVLFTYIIGKRADAYFNRGPDAMGDIKDNLRALTGVDEQKIVQWVTESSRSLAQVSAKAGSSLVEGGRRGIVGIADAGRRAGRTAATLAGRVLGRPKAGDATALPQEADPAAADDGEKDRHS